MRHGLFVYGTLQLPEKLQSLLGRVPSLEPATLHGYRCGLVARAELPKADRRRGANAAPP